METHQLINQNSSDVEIFTPQEIIEAARICMGGISLDPASCKEANKRVKAINFHSIKQDGMHQNWSGNVWLNFPFGRREEPCPSEKCPRKLKNPKHVCHDYTLHGNQAWVEKVMLEFSKGMRQACMITFASTSEAWFKPLLYLPQCFLTPRTNYIKPDGSIYKGVSKGSVVTYIGPDSCTRKFASAFQHLGVIKIPYVREQEDK